VKEGKGKGGEFVYALLIISSFIQHDYAQQ